MQLEDLLINANKRVDDLHEMQRLGLHCNTGEFVPAGLHYPYITGYPNIKYEDMFKGYTMPDDEMLDVYVHIPYCKKRCIYCHYPSHYNAPDSEKDVYLDAMEKEMDIYLRTLGIDKIKLRVALIGGGTPTDLTPKQLKRFLEMFTKRCDMSKMRQFNYDVSPSTLINADGLERLKILKDYGVDRITIGVQSMNDDILKLMNRDHNKKEAIEAIKNTMNAGFKTNIEFIYGHPGQTIEGWYQELQEMVRLETDEIQFYRLKVDAFGDQQGTIKQYKELHPEKCPSPEDTIRMKQMVFDYLAEFGYKENLRRVFTRDKKNLSLSAFNACCMLYDLIAFGVTGYSTLRDRFVLNTQSFEEYYSRINQGLLPFNRGFVRDADAQQRWALLLPLKNYFVRKNHYKRVTGVDIENTKLYSTIQTLKKYDLVTEDDSIIKLTSKGVFFADEISICFFASEFMPKERKYYNEGELNPYSLS